MFRMKLTLFLGGRFMRGVFNLVSVITFSRFKVTFVSLNGTVNFEWNSFLSSLYILELISLVTDVNTSIVI